MDIDVYHWVTLAIAVAAPVGGWFLTKSKKAIPGLAVAFVLLVIAAMHAGLAPIESRYHKPRYMYGAIIMGLGLMTWVLTLSRFCDKAREE